MVHLITYDLNKPLQNYSGMHDSIKSIGSWWHYLESTWLVDTTLSASSIFEKLSSKLDSNDRLFITKITRDNAGYLPKDAWDWINSKTLAFA